MKVKYLFVLVWTMISILGFSQNSYLCPKQSFFIKISNPSNIPTVVTNSNTITLIHTEQYITDIFSNYTIYDFELTTFSSDLYVIKCESKDLINDLYNNVPSTIFLIDNDFQSTVIDPAIITFLDGKMFNLKS